ncbi:unnamed protein product, partial [Adineta steineri]
TESPDDIQLASMANSIQDLQDENYRLKVGLGVGLGAGVLTTGSAAAGTFLYFSRRVAQLQSAI